MSRLKQIAVAIAAVLFAGCPTPYVYNGVSYQTTGEAYQAMEANLRGVKAQIRPLPNPVCRELTVVLPTIETIDSRGLFVQRSLADPTRLTRAQRRYLVLSEQRGELSMVEFIERRNLCEDVVTAAAPDPSRRAATLREQRATVLYVTYPERGVAVWMLDGPKDRSAVPVPLDPTVPVGYPRTMKWLTTLERVLEAPQ